MSRSTPSKKSIAGGRDITDLIKGRAHLPVTQTQQSSSRKRALVVTDQSSTVQNPTARNETIACAFSLIFFSLFLPPYPIIIT